MNCNYLYAQDSNTHIYIYIYTNTASQYTSRTRYNEKIAGVTSHFSTCTIIAVKAEFRI